MELVKPGETIEDLQYKNLKIIQNKQLFCFGMDAVLLADFAKVKKNERVLDLCTGSGIIPILLYGKNKAKSIHGIEIMPYVADMAARSCELNGISNTVKIIEADIKDAQKHFDEVLDVITVNPPYEKVELNLKSGNEYRMTAKHEVLCDLEDVLEVSSKLLKFGGRFYMIHRVARFAQIIETMKKFRLRPKRVRFIHPNEGKNANLVLFEGMKEGKEGLLIEYPLFVRDANGNYTDEIETIYHRNEAD